MRSLTFRPAASHFVLLLAISLIGGCGATVYSPPHPINPTPIYVADYGRHSSVFFPMPQGGYVEYSFGDWNFYAMGKTSNSDGAAALLWSCSATLARRYTPSTTGAPEPLFQPRIFQLSAANADVQRVRDGLEQRWHSLLKTRVYNPAIDTEFVRDPIHYSWFYNCNNWTAHVLRDTGCNVVGMTTLSAFHPGDKSPATLATRSNQIK